MQTILSIFYEDIQAVKTSSLTSVRGFCLYFTIKLHILIFMIMVFTLALSTFTHPKQKVLQSQYSHIATP